MSIRDDVRGSRIIAAGSAVTARIDLLMRGLVRRSAVIASLRGVFGAIGQGVSQHFVLFIVVYALASLALIRFVFSGVPAISVVAGIALLVMVRSMSAR